MRYGTGDHQYELVPNWAHVPEGWSFLDVCGIAVDAQDDVYVLNRSEHPVIVFDRDGRILRRWGHGFFGRAHGARLAPDGSIFCTDDVGHVVAKFSTNGDVLMTLGHKGTPTDTGYRHTWDVFQSTSTIAHSGPPFNRPTGVAITPAGDIFVSDGYGNARIHHFDASGKLLHSWGEPGGEPGRFRLPHDVAVDAKGRLLVADRENGRIQLFDQEGNLLEVRYNVIRPTGICVAPDGLTYVSQLCMRVSVFDSDGRIVTQWGNASTVKEEALFVAPHAVAVDSRGDVYVGEVAVTHGKIDRGARTIQKFARVR